MKEPRSKLTPDLVTPSAVALIGIPLDGHTQGVQQPGHRAVEGGREGQLDAGLGIGMLVQHGVDLVQDAPVDEGVSEGEGSSLGVSEGRGGSPHRQLRDLVLVNTCFCGYKAVLGPLVLRESALGSTQNH